MKQQAAHEAPSHHACRSLCGSAALQPAATPPLCCRLRAAAFRSLCCARLLRTTGEACSTQIGASGPPASQAMALPPRAPCHCHPVRYRHAVACVRRLPLPSGQVQARAALRTSVQGCCRLRPAADRSAYHLGKMRSASLLADGDQLLFSVKEGRNLISEQGMSQPSKILCNLSTTSLAACTRSRPPTTPLSSVSPICLKKLSREGRE